MYFKTKTVKGRKYKYAAKSIRLPDGKVASLEVAYKGESDGELQRIFEAMEKKKNLEYVLEKFHEDPIFTGEELAKVESMKMDYRRIMRGVSSPAMKDMLDRFTANFTYESNALEGNSLTLKDVRMVIFENRAIKGKDLREIYDARNSRQVVDLIVRNKLKISREDILKMHRMLVKDTDVRSGYKQFPNYILGRNIHTTLPEDVEVEMDRLIEWYSSQGGKIHPIKLAALFHGKFERIHPFEDGNGRVGRFLINTILTSNRYPPMIIRKSQRVSYLHALESFDNGHPEFLERYLLAGYKDTFSKFFEIYWRYIPV